MLPQCLGYAIVAHMFRGFLVVCLLITTLAAAMPARAVPCTGVNEHIYTVDVQSNAVPVSGAQIGFYRESSYTFLADNRLVSGAADAQITSGSNGSATISLEQGFYYVQIIASGYENYRTNVTVPADGTCGHTTIHLTNPGQVTLDPARSTSTLDLSFIYADLISSAIVTIQAYNTVGSVMPNVAVNLTGSLTGLRITAHATSTDGAGRARFTVQGSLPGSAILSPVLGSYGLAPHTLQVLAGSSTSSAIVSRSLSSVTLGGSPADATGQPNITVTVTARTESGAPVVGSPVSIRPTAADIIVSPAYGLTDVNGRAFFTMASTKPTVGTVAALLGFIALDDRPSFTFLKPLYGTTPFVPLAPYYPMGTRPPVGALIKLPDDGDVLTQPDSTVYYIGSDGRRHPFLHSRYYLTWYTHFNDVRTAAPEVMASFALGNPVPFRPGRNFLKFESDPHVYALSSPGIIRWVQTEDVAAAILGLDWNKKVFDYPASEFVHFVGGDVIDQASDYDAIQEYMNSDIPDRTFASSG